MFLLCYDAIKTMRSKRLLPERALRLKRLLFPPTLFKVIAPVIQALRVRVQFVPTRRLQVPEHLHQTPRHRRALSQALFRVLIALLALQERARLLRASRLQVFVHREQHRRRRHGARARLFIAHRRRARSSARFPSRFRDLAIRASRVARRRRRSRSRGGRFRDVVGVDARSTARPAPRPRRSRAIRARLCGVARSSSTDSIDARADRARPSARSRAASAQNTDRYNRYVTFASRRACVDVAVAASASSARPLSVRSSVAARRRRSRRAPLDPRLDARADAATASANARRDRSRRARPGRRRAASRRRVAARAVVAARRSASSSGDAIGASA